MNAELTRFFASGAAQGSYSDEEIRRVLSGLREKERQEKADKTIYDTQQNPFLIERLPQLIKELSAELEQLNQDAWEGRSFERAVRVVLRIETAYRPLCGIGYQALFKTNFNFHVARVVDPIFRMINGGGGSSELQVLMSPNYQQICKQNLERIFKAYRPESNIDGLTEAEKTNAFAFLLLLRQETMK